MDFKKTKKKRNQELEAEAFKCFAVIGDDKILLPVTSNSTIGISFNHVL